MLSSILRRLGEKAVSRKAAKPQRAQRVQRSRGSSELEWKSRLSAALTLVAGWDLNPRPLGYERNFLVARPFGF
jgi:hypothetical protein